MCKKSNISSKVIIINSVLILLIALLIVYNLNYKLVKVDGDSMYPKLSDGQYVLINKKCDDISSGDIVVFETNDGYSVKRVIASDSDIVTLLENTVYVNEIRVTPYTYDGELSVTYNLEENDYFVIGDNYLVSYDSRDYGPIHKTDIIGKVVINICGELQ